MEVDHKLAKDFERMEDWIFAVHVFSNTDMIFQPFQYSRYANQTAIEKYQRVCNHFKNHLPLN